uniref:Uncharacterized protein n=1 Tax=Oryza rufipogon TaxID=4529 RepID=A0A0E0MVP8_ORYRU
MPVASTFDGDMLGWWSACRREMAKEHRRNVDGLFIYTTWGIWLQRNARIFNGTYSTVMQVVDSIIAMCKAYIGAHEKDETISGLHMFPRVSDGSLRRSFLLPGDAATRRGSLHRPRWQGPTWAKAHQRSSSRACGKATEEERQHTAARVVAAEQRHGPRRQVEDGKLDVSIVEPGRASFISRQLLNVMANLFDPLTMRSSLATVRHGSREQNSGFALASGASITQVDIDGEMLVP